MDQNDAKQPPAQYWIRLQGHLDTRWSDWFDGLTISHEPDGTTLLTGPIADQAALHGVLVRIGSLGLPLLALSQSRATTAFTSQETQNKVE